MDIWDNWAAAVIHPLGVASFALFLTFLVLTKFSKGRFSTFMSGLFVVMAICSLVGGFLIYFKQIDAKQDSAKLTATEKKQSNNLSTLRSNLNSSQQNSLSAKKESDLLSENESAENESAKNSNNAGNDTQAPGSSININVQFRDINNNNGNTTVNIGNSK